MKSQAKKTSVKLVAAEAPDQVRLCYVMLCYVMLG